MIDIQVQKLRKLPLFLLGIFSLLFILNMLTIIVTFTTGHENIYGLLPLFDFGEENNIPTYYSSMNLLLSAVLLYFIYRIHKLRGTVDSRPWFFLSLFFLYLSIDEFATIHELLGKPLNDLFGFTSQWLYYPWVIVGMIVVALFAVFFLKFFLRLPFRYKILFSISAILFAGGAIGMEIGDAYFSSLGTSRLTTYIFVMLEESMEMLGILTFIYALIDYMNKETVDQPLSDQSEVAPVSIRN